MPSFPAGQRTYVNNDFYALNAYSKNPPELAWEILKFLALDRGFAQLQYKTTFITPNQTALWPEWIEVVRQVAPPLRGKNLEAYMGAARYATAQYFFRYDNNGASNIFNQYMSLMVSGQLTPKLGLAEITGRINALEASGAALARADALQARRARTEISQAEAGRLTRFSPPDRVGVGAAFTPAPQRVTVRAGTHTLTGSGAGLTGANADGTFACDPATAARAAYTVRLVAFRNVNESPMDRGAKAGLLLRQNLSDDAPGIAVVVSGKEGVIVASQGFSEVAASHQRLGNAGTLLVPPSAARGKNFLKAPLWLRLVRDVATFRAFTSVDGRTWRAAGAPVTIPLASAWIGLFVTSHESGKGVQAAFDHIQGFTPRLFVALGS